MTNHYDVAILVGSLRRKGISSSVANALMALSPPTLALRTVEIGHLPLYDPDRDGEDAPEAWASFRSEIASANGVLFVTPEYNRSVPAALKNAIDVGSRPYGRSVWAGKPAGIVSVSPGGMGGFGANHYLRQSLVFLDMPTLQQPEAYLGGIANPIETADALPPTTREFLSAYMAAFATWVDRHAGVRTLELAA